MVFVKMHFLGLRITFQIENKAFVSSQLSEAMTVKNGVLQGSIQGPVLFIMYINNLPDCLQYSKFIIKNL